MKMNYALSRIKELLDDRNWTVYRLSKESGVPYSSLNSLINKNNYPTIPTLEKICGAFKISLSEFFLNSPRPVNHIDYLSKEELNLIEVYRVSDNKNKEIIKNIVEALKNN